MPPAEFERPCRFGSLLPIVGLSDPSVGSRQPIVRKNKRPVGIAILCRISRVPWNHEESGTAIRTWTSMRQCFAVLRRQCW